MLIYIRVTGTKRENVFAEGQEELQKDTGRDIFRDTERDIQRGKEGFVYREKREKEK